MMDVMKMRAVKQQHRGLTKSAMAKDLYEVLRRQGTLGILSEYAEHLERQAAEIYEYHENQGWQEERVMWAERKMHYIKIHPDFYKWWRGKKLRKQYWALSLCLSELIREDFVVRKGGKQDEYDS